MPPSRFIKLSYFAAGLLALQAQTLGEILHRLLPPKAFRRCSISSYHRNAKWGKWQ